MPSNEDLSRDQKVIDEERAYKAWVDHVLSLTRASPSTPPRGLARTGPTDAPVDWLLLIRPGGKSGGR